MQKNRVKALVLITAGLLGLAVAVVLVAVLKYYALVAIALLMLWSVVIENAWLKVERLAVSSPKVDQTVRLLQISDFHSNGWVLRHIKRVIAEEYPDAIVLTGDTFDWERLDNDSARDLVRYLAGLNIPVLLIYGQHEMDCPEFWREVKLLMPDRIQYLGYRSSAIAPDVSCFGADFDSQKLRFQLNDARFNILLTYAPSDATAYADRFDFDLILCGHEHGGQVRLPLIGAVLDASGRLFSDWRGYHTRGVFKHNKSLIYVDSGAGYGVMPVRFLCRSQVTLITIGAQK